MGRTEREEGKGRESERWKDVRKGHSEEEKKKNMDELEDVGQRQIMLKSRRQYFHFILEYNG